MSCNAKVSLDGTGWPRLLPAATPTDPYCAHGYDAVALRRAIQANHGIPRVTNQAKTVFFELLQAATVYVAHLVTSRSHSASSSRRRRQEPDRRSVRANRRNLQGDDSGFQGIG